MADKEKQVKVATPLPTFDKKDIEEHKVWGAVGYLGLLFLVPLLLKKDSPYALACAKQGLVLFVAQFIAGLTAFIFVGFVLVPIISIMMIVGFIKAITGNYWRVPLIGEMGEKLKI